MHTLTITRARAALACGLTLALLQGCGGGDGGSTDTPPPNRPPVLLTNSLTGNEDSTLDGQLAATDPENQPLTFTRTSNAQHGTVTVGASGAIAYVPEENYSGTDTFSVRIADSAGGQTAGTVTITVAPVNDSPSMTFDAFAVDEDTNYSQQLVATDPDGDALVFSVGGAAAHGTAAITPGGALTYRAVSNYYGTDSFVVRLADGVGAPVDVAITVTVNGVNHAPVASDDEFRIPSGTPMTFAPAANDSDGDDEALTVSIESQPGGGTVTAGPDNVITFVPSNGFRGPLEFQYRVTDPRGASDTATIRALIGNFQDIILISDQLQATAGRRDILRFDGLSLTRIVASPPADAALPDIVTFRLSGDLQWLFYLVSGPLFDAIYRVPLTGGTPQFVWQNAANFAGPGPVGLQTFAVNHDGTYLWVTDRYRSGTKRHLIVNVASGAETLLAGSEAGIVQTPLVGFNPRNPNQILLQGQIGGATPPDGQTESYSFFSASTGDASVVTQLGGNYPQNYGSGSGYGWYVSGDGRYIYHNEQLAGASPTPVQRVVLVYDTVTQTEDVMYRRPQAGERGTGGMLYMSNDGSKICFPYGDISGAYFLGPAEFHVGSGASPAAAGPITPSAPAVGSCTFGADNDTLVYSPRSGAGVTNELYSMPTSVVAAPTRLSHALAAGEVLAVTAHGRSAMRTVIGYRYPPSLISDLYLIPTDGSAPERLFMTGFPNIGSGGEHVNDDATLLAFFQADMSLTLASTAGLQLLTPVTTRPVTQFRWVR